MNLEQKWRLTAKRLEKKGKSVMFAFVMLLIKRFDSFKKSSALDSSSSNAPNSDKLFAFPLISENFIFVDFNRSFSTLTLPLVNSVRN